MHWHSALKEDASWHRALKEALKGALKGALNDAFNIIPPPSDAAPNELLIVGSNEPANSGLVKVSPLQRLVYIAYLDHIYSAIKSFPSIPYLSFYQQSGA